MRYEILRKRDGEPVEGFPRVFARKVYDGCPIFQHRDFDEFLFTTSLTILHTPRWEYIVYDDNDEIVASMAVHKEFDCHVGECLSVLVAFSTDNHALFKAYRWMMKLAKEEMCPFVAYTRKTGDYKLDLTYRKVL